MISILCRYGELFLKSGNRRRFERALADNVRRAVRDLPDAQVATPHGRILVRVPDETARGRLRPPRARVRPGVVLGRRRGRAQPRGHRRRRGQRGQGRHRPRSRPAAFKVETRRADKRFPMRSLEIDCHVGARVIDATRPARRRAHARLRIGIEVGTKHGFVYAETRAAPGGLPVGASGRGLLLLSGGIDSPVAGWLAAKRGLALDALPSTRRRTSARSRDKVLSLLRILARWQALRSVHVVPFTEAQKRLRDAGPGRAGRGALPPHDDAHRRPPVQARRADALVTGENLGQVASQT